MRILLRHLGHEFESENVSVEGAAACKVADRNGHVQDAFGLDHVKLPCSDGVPSGGNFPYQLGENFTHDQHGTAAGAIFAKGIDNLRLKPSDRRQPKDRRHCECIHGTFGCRNRSMTRGGLWEARSITAWICAPVRRPVGPSPNVSPAARKSGSAMVAANAARNAARRSTGMPGGIRNGRPSASGANAACITSLSSSLATRSGANGTSWSSASFSGPYCTMTFAALS